MLNEADVVSWYTDDSSGSHILDLDTDNKAQLSLILSSEGTTKYAIHVGGNAFVGIVDDAADSAFIRHLSAWLAYKLYHRQGVVKDDGA